MLGLITNMKLKYKIFLGFSLVSILFITVAIFSFIANTSIKNEAYILKDRSYTNLQLAQGLLSDFKYIGDHLANAGTFQDMNKLSNPFFQQ